jgi:hypothetical protein
VGDILGGLVGEILGRLVGEILGRLVGDILGKIICLVGLNKQLPMIILVYNL